MNKIIAEEKAHEVVKLVVNLLSQKCYEEIGDIVDMDALQVDDIKELVNGFLELNELEYIDAFDVECNFNPSYEYNQMSFYHYNDGSGFAVDYDLTTNKELNDLTLQLEFIYDGQDNLKGTLLDLHVM